MKDKMPVDELGVKALLKYANSIIAILREPFLVLDKNLRVISANHAFYTTFRVAEKDTTGQQLSDLGDKQWNIPKLLQLLKEVLPKKEMVRDYVVEHKFERIGERIMRINACQSCVPKKVAGIIVARVEEEKEEEKEEELILLSIEDITEFRLAEMAVKKHVADLEAFNKVSVDRELKMIEMKKEIDALLRRLGEKTKYNSV